MKEDRIRSQLLEVAARRFTDYGYGKTTVAEIAKDCGMSSGNVYRYYDSKEAIAIAGVEEKIEEKLATCEAATDLSAPAIRQLRQYLLTRLRFTHAFNRGGAHLHELVQLITDRHHDIIDKYDKRVIAWLAQIIGRGIERGEFRPQDAEQAAASILVATVMFSYPNFMQEPLDSMELKLSGLLELLHEALKA